MKIADNRKEFELPQSGMYLGVVVDVIDLGLTDTQWGKKMKLRIVWLLNRKDSQGNPYRVITEPSQSLHEKAALYSIAKDIMGVAPGPDFDTDHLIGRVNQLVIRVEYVEKKQRSYANINGIWPVPPELAGEVPAVKALAAGYQRTQYQAGGQQQRRSAPPPQGQPTQQPVQQPQGQAAYQPPPPPPVQQTQPPAPAQQAVADDDIPF